MPQVFARIELRGDPDEEVYENLHEYMESKNWTRKSPKGYDLPHATYRGDFENENPDLAAISKSLKNHIASNIWTRVIVLIVTAANWRLDSA